MLQIVANQQITVCPYTLHQWLNEWLITYKKPNVKDTTLYATEVAIRCHIKPNLPDIPLNDIDGLMLQKFILSIKKSRTRKTVYNTLTASFRDAFSLKYIKENPMLAVHIPAHKYKQGENLTKEETITFIENIKGHTLENYFLFLLYSGCRRGEALTIKISDIDFKKNVIHIRGSKTEKSDRIIPLFEKLSDLLPKIKPNSDGFLFPYRPDYPTHAFKKLCPNHKLHDLRHTFATNCLEAEIPLKVVQKWLGHSDIDVTANIYTHVSPEINHTEATKLDSFYK